VKATGYIYVKVIILSIGYFYELTQGRYALAADISKLWA
jgi:hypothetical protein